MKSIRTPITVANTANDNRRSFGGNCLLIHTPRGAPKAPPAAIALPTRNSINFMRDFLAKTTTAMAMTATIDTHTAACGPSPNP